MLNITEDSIISAADIAGFLGKTERTAGEWIKAHGGKKVCGTWVILGARMKSALMDPDALTDESSEQPAAAPERRHFKRRSL